MLREIDEHAAREAASAAAKGASVVYQCLNAPYTEWPQRFPGLQRSVLAAAQRADARLVSLENVYGYGPTGGQPMTEDAEMRDELTRLRAIIAGRISRVSSVRATMFT